MRAIPMSNKPPSSLFPENAYLVVFLWQALIFESVMPLRENLSATFIGTRRSALHGMVFIEQSKNKVLPHLPS